MAKQVHLRLNDTLYKEIVGESKKQGKNVQDTVSDLIMSGISKKTVGSADGTKQLTFIDLFAGIGGLRLAYEMAGCQCVYSNEWNKYSQRTYFANFGVLPEGDITKVDASSIPDHDILVGGFPCQPFSIAGVSKKNSLGRATGFEDKTQGTLFFDVCRVIKAKRPKAFMYERLLGRAS